MLEAIDFIDFWLKNFLEKRLIFDYKFVFCGYGRAAFTGKI